MRATTMAASTPRRNAGLVRNIPGGGADVFDIRRRQCSLPRGMPEANHRVSQRAGSSPEDGTGESPGQTARAAALARPFDEDEARPVPPPGEQDGATLTPPVGVIQRLLSPDGCPGD